MTLTEAGACHAAGTIRVSTRIVEPPPLPAGAFLDLTDDLAAFVATSGVRHGTASVHALHTTMAVVVNEDEPLLLDDARAFLDRLLPAGIGWGHDDLARRTVNVCEDECANGHAHLRALLMGSSKTVPVLDRALILGRWQRVLVVELDRPRQRRVVFQVVGV